MMRFFLFMTCATFWGGSFVAIKYVLTGMSPIVGAWLRVTIAMLFLFIYCKITKKSLAVPRSIRWRVWLTGLFSSGFPFALLFWGEQKISAGLAGIINGTTPIWTFLLGLIFLRQVENFTLRKFVGLLIGLIGIVLIFYPTLTISQESQAIFGTLAVFGMAICYGVSIVMNRFLASGKTPVDTFPSVFQQHVACSVFLGLLALTITIYQNSFTLDTNWQAIASVLYLGILSSGTAMIIFYTLIKAWGAVRTSTITYIVPITALIFDRLIFGHTPNHFELIGILIVISAMALIQRSKKTVSPS